MDLESLRALTPRRRRVWAQTHQPDEEIVEVLHREHIRQRPISLPMAQDWALNAVLAARRLPTKAAREWVPRSLAHFANCHRLNDQFDAALANIQAAERLAQDASPAVQQEVANTYASIFLYLQRLSDAEAMIRRSVQSIRRFGTRQDLGLQMALRGLVFIDQGRPKEAVVKCVQGLDLIDLQESPIVTLSLSNNLANALVLCGQTEAARDTVNKIHPQLYLHLFGDTGIFRRQLLLARIAKAEGDLATAASTLLALRQCEPPPSARLSFYLELELIELFRALRLREEEAHARFQAKVFRTHLGIEVAESPQVFRRLYR